MYDFHLYLYRFALSIKNSSNAKLTVIKDAPIDGSAISRPRYGALKFRSAGTKRKSSLKVSAKQTPNADQLSASASSFNKPAEFITFDLVSNKTSPVYNGIRHRGKPADVPILKGAAYAKVRSPSEIGDLE